MMNASRHLRNVSMGSVFQYQAQIPRKYRGEHDDPHHIPDSPLISRQFFTWEEEAELTRTCTAVLAHVPHSDEMTDDPFRYLASHITVENDVCQLSEVCESSQPDFLHETQPSRSMRVITDTATPSITSKRDTWKTDTSTPLTSPGYTPAETGKRLSDAIRQHSMANSATSARYRTKSSKDNNPYLVPQNQHDVVDAEMASGVKSMSNLPNLVKFKLSQQNSVELGNHNTDVVSVSHPDLHRRFPVLSDSSCIQAVRTAETMPSGRHGGLSRIFKTVKVRKTQSAAEVNPRKTTSTDVPRLLLSPQRPPPTKKHSFNFASVFHRKKKNLAAIQIVTA